MRHPEVLYMMVKERQDNLRHEAELVRGIKGFKKASGPRSVLGNLRVLLSSFL